MTFLKAIYFSFLCIVTFSSLLAAEVEKPAGPLFREWSQGEFHTKYINKNAHLPFYGLLQTYTAGGTEESKVTTIRMLDAYARGQGWTNFMVKDSEEEDKSASDHRLAIRFLLTALPSVTQEATRNNINSTIDKLVALIEKKPNGYGSLDDHSAVEIREEGGVQSAAEISCWAKYWGRILCGSCTMLTGGATLLTLYLTHKM